MGQTIIGPPAGNIPYPFVSPIIEAKAKWSDPWQFRPDLTMVSCGVHTGHAPTLEIERRYGSVKFPFDVALNPLNELTLTNWWIRLSFPGPQGPQIQFVGQIPDTANAMNGGNLAPSGQQNWVAYGGMLLLEKQQVSDAYVLNADDTVTKIGFIPTMNSNDKRGMIVGNESGTLDPASKVFMYGGTGIWSHGDYLDYLVAKFVQQPGGPTWTIGGQSEVLDDIQTTIDFGDDPTAAAMIKKLVPVHYGLDWIVTPTDAGFEVTIFALTATPITFAGVTLPANPNTVEVLRQKQLDLIEVKVVDSTQKKCDRIQVLGKRIVVCGTLRSDQSAGLSTLQPKWNQNLETEYINGGSLTVALLDPELADEARKREKYKELYQHFGAPTGWTWGRQDWSLATDDTGALKNAPWQDTIRETLHWIPLKEGFDYTTDPPTNNTLSDAEPVRPPIAFVIDTQPDTAPVAPATQPAPVYIQCELHGMSVHAPYHDWGVMVHASPNHRLAMNHWSAGQLDTTDLDTTEKYYDYNTLVATIAIESDHRLQIGFTVPAAQAAGDGSTITIVDEHAEMWVLLPGTKLDVSPTAPTQLVDSGDTRRILRNDVPRLALVMAGAISRYSMERGRAQLTFKGFQPWGNLVGNILTVIQQAGFTQIYAPITSVEWILSPAPQTILKTGYA